MYYTDGKNITVPRGDRALIAFTFIDEDGETPYILTEGQYARFDVYKTADSEPEITKTATAAEQSEDGTVVFALTPEDTDVKRHGYFYTLRLMNADGSVDTVVGAPVRAFLVIC